MNVPIVLVNKTINQCGFLEHVVKQACRNDNEVFLLGDDNNKHYCDGTSAMYIPFSIFKSCEEFEKRYIHLSTNNKDIEIFCFSRWFIMRDFMKENHIEAALYIDSDVLYFSNATKEFKRFENYYCALSGRTSGHTSYWTLEGLEKFCEYLLTIYSNPSSYEFSLFNATFNLRQNYGLHGGICDMSLLEHFARFGYPHMVGEVSILTDGSYHDHVVSVSEGFEMQHGIKRFEIDVKGTPLAKHIKTGAWIPFASIHCQGSNKHLITTLYNAASPTSTSR
jgi:hypothetical protein